MTVGVILMLFALPVWAFVDAAARPASHWRRSGHDRVVWLLVIMFFGPVGAAV